MCPGKEREDVERTEDPIRRHPRFLCLSTVEEGVLGGLGESSAGLARLRRSDVVLGAVAERKGAVKEAEVGVIPLPQGVIGVGGPPDSGPAQVGSIWVDGRGRSRGRGGGGKPLSGRGLLGEEGVRTENGWCGPCDPGLQLLCQLDESVDKRPCSRWNAGGEEECQFVERLGGAVCQVELVEGGQGTRLDDLGPVDGETASGDEGVLPEGEAEPLLRGENQGRRVGEGVRSLKAMMAASQNGDRQAGFVAGTS